MPNWIPDNVDLFVARKIRQLRKEQKISVSKMARYLNIPPQKLKQSEQALCPLSAGLLSQIAYALGCDLQDLFPPRFIRSDPIKEMSRKISDFRSFSEELIRAYLIGAPDDNG
ncbi:MAG: helix-turn-helix transcriptional regulator [Pseudomonadota bacterium]|nr:helix-turn-helix transcriptional regulator [Pseudomonadota bacterium]